MAASSEGAHEILLLTRPQCSLCQGARDVVERVTARLGMSWSEKSVVDDAELLARFAEELPVLLIDGVQRDFWIIDEARLERLLRR